MLRLTKPRLGNEETEALRKVLDSGWLAEGDLTRQFESEVARYVGAKYAVAFCNCTAAMTLCLIAEGIRGRVTIPDFTHPATAQAVINARCTPVLCDVSLESYNIAEYSNSVGTSIPVSWGGNPLGWYPPAFIVEDAACSLGASADGVKVGSRFTTCFSFHPRKIITTGEGAIVTTNSKELSLKLRDLKRFGKGGGNFKFNDIAAAIGIEQLRKIEEIIKVRREMAEIYNTLLSDVNDVVTPKENSGTRHTYQTYAVLLKKGNRDEIINRLALKGIETQIGTYALHCLPQFRRLQRMSKLENSEKLYNNLLALPMSYDLTFDDQKHVVAELKNAISETSNA
jgi:dTDP-4-amino-4,6-dideoxygalactose transaminase